MNIKILAIIKYSWNNATYWRHWSNNIPTPQLLATFYLRAAILYLQVLSKEIYDLPTVAIKNQRHPHPIMSCFIFKFKPHSKTSLNINYMWKPCAKHVQVVPHNHMNLFINHSISVFKPEKQKRNTQSH